MSIVNVNHYVLNSLAYFVGQMAPEDFRQPLAIYNGSSLGEHTRHIIEFYQCLVSQCGNGWVSYDQRMRNRALQEQPGTALEGIHQVRQQLEGLQLDQCIMLHVNPHIEGGEVQQLPSTIHRELLYVLDHAIHHMALIKIGVAVAHPQVQLPADFGVAPSTIRSRQTIAP